MVRAAVCHPLATSPPKKVPAAAFSSVWNGCGSYCDAKALMVSAVSVTDADLNCCPTAKSSQYRSSAIICSLKLPHPCQIARVSAEIVSQPRGADNEGCPRPVAPSCDSVAGSKRSARNTTLVASRTCATNPHSRSRKPSVAPERATQSWTSLPNPTPRGHACLVRVHAAAWIGSNNAIPRLESLVTFRPRHPPELAGNLKTAAGHRNV